MGSNLLNIGARAMLANQAALGVSGHNIANAPGPYNHDSGHSFSLQHKPAMTPVQYGITPLGESMARAFRLKSYP